MFWWKLWEMVVVTHRSASWSKKEWKWWRNEHKIFFFTLFQNFMIPLDSSWWDLFKSAEPPQFTINLPSLFGTYLWIFFIFTSVPILKKSCCRKNQIFSRNIIPSGEIGSHHPLDDIFGKILILPTTTFFPLVLSMVSRKKKK